jgi:nucleotidyltransferase substrate binding protein (TIGR01987 family)
MTDIRWKQRFQNFEKAYNNLKTILDELNIDKDSIINKMATIQAFEIVMELAWKTLKDYMDENYVLIKEVFPKTVIKEAFATNIIKNGEIWIDMLKDRNSTSHEYSEEKSNEIIEKIDNVYFNEIMQVYNYLKGKIDE